MLELDEAQAALLSRLRRASEIEQIPVQGALNRVLAAEACALVDNPAFDNSAMDGYAAASQALSANHYCLPLIGESRCGAEPSQLTPDSCQRIFTGAPLPGGADTVAIQEEVSVSDDDQVCFPQELSRGANIRRRGEDFTADQVLFAPGHRLRSPDIALMSAAGIPEVGVYRRPRAVVLATGDELVAPGNPLNPGQIYESNRIVTMLMLKELGAEVTDGGTVADDPDTLREALAQYQDHDFIITSGGASVGDHDLVKQVFAELGSIEFWRVRIKPGKPVAFGHIGRKGHFFALPGNPVSSIVTFKLFVAPALLAWCHGTPRWQVFPLPAMNAFKRRPGRMEFLRAAYRNQGGMPGVEILSGQGSHMLAPLAQCDGFVRLAVEKDGVEEGEIVDFIPLDGFA